MGEHADDLINRMIDGSFGWGGGRQRRKTFQSGSGQYKWKQANGQVIAMKDMSIRHLGNALRMAEAHGNTGKADDLREVLGIKEAEEAADLLDRNDEYDSWAT